MHERVTGAGNDQQGVKVRVLTWVRPPVFSGEKPAGSQDLRPIQIVPPEVLPDGAVIANDPADGVLIAVGAARPKPDPIEWGA